ncbi:TolC family protein [Pedobacter alpinus]|uniref:TolC family protein n=1 Tax=Pedobacter alpinus TaxID=1590643 RepID=A0ABW5TPK8_9SPHI
MRLGYYLLFLMVFFCSELKAQTLDTLTFTDFINIVKINHPVTVQAKLLADLAKARKTQALGGFDPKLDAEFDRKFYDGTEYYSFLTPQVKLPLWYGLELKGSYSQAEGSYLNPESKLPSEGLSYAGLSFQLGKGLLMDSRRAAFKQASIFEQSSQNEQVRILNDLFQDAAENFINWQNKYLTAQVYDNALGLARTRYEATRLGFLGGDKPAIDTVEAMVNVQQREVQWQQAQLELQQAKYMLSTFLWLTGNLPVDVEKLNIIPSNNIEVPLTAQTDIINNPKLLSYNFKISDLNIERRLKAESLKPELGVSLGLLNQGGSALRNINPTYWNENNKVNVRFSFPLTFSKARGDLAEAKIKIRQTELEQKVVENDLQNKLNQNNSELIVLQNQLNVLNRTYRASEQLLNGEEMKLRLGESSLFMVNSRESKLIEVKEKQLAVDAKLKKAQMKSLWLKGLLFELL